MYQPEFLEFLENFDGIDEVLAAHDAIDLPIELQPITNDLSYSELMQWTRIGEISVQNPDAESLKEQFSEFVELTQRWFEKVKIAMENDPEAKVLLEEMNGNDLPDPEYYKECEL